MVKFVELSSLENYLDGSEQRTHQKTPQVFLHRLLLMQSTLIYAVFLYSAKMWDTFVAVKN